MSDELRDEYQFDYDEATPNRFKVRYTPKPHLMNVPGDYYVEDGCCSCEIPFAEAPDLFAWDGSHCYIQRQPDSSVEVEQMHSAIGYADLACIRYRGTDHRIQLGLIQRGEALQCDNLPTGFEKEIAEAEAERSRMRQEFENKYRAVPSRPWWKFW